MFYSRFDLRVCEVREARSHVNRFRIAAAQVASASGDIERNVETHCQAIEAAARRDVGVLVFPELSLTGYEPELAASLALVPTDERLGPLAGLARRHRMEVVVGAPLANADSRGSLRDPTPARGAIHDFSRPSLMRGSKPHLGAIVFRADGSRATYAKMHLGGDEPAHFEPGAEPFSLRSRGRSVGLAICADAGQPSHPRTYADAGADVYAAGVFLTAEWHATDMPRLAGHAATHRLLVVMANHGASDGTLKSVGQSAVWAPGGALLARVEDTRSALVIAAEDDEGWRGDVVAI